MASTLVLGQNGQLARAIREVAGSRSIDFLGRDEIAAHDFSVIGQTLRSLRPAVVINCTGYTAVDKAENDQAACFLLNRDLPAELARLSRELGFHLVHYSTDYVFDGESSEPYRETDECRPRLVYGDSKRQGELAVLETATSAWVVRTSWVYSIENPSFLKTMLRLADQEGPLRVVDDQRGTPTWSYDLAQVTLEKFAQPTGRAEIVHYSGQGETTWCGFAREIMKVWAKEKVVQAISTAEYPTPAQRPRNSVLSKVKAEKVFGLKIADWRESLAACHAKGRKADNAKGVSK